LFSLLLFLLIYTDFKIGAIPRRLAPISFFCSFFLFLQALPIGALAHN